jgi:hypothetical protein
MKCTCRAGRFAGWKKYQLSRPDLKLSLFSSASVSVKLPSGSGFSQSVRPEGVPDSPSSGGGGKFLCRLFKFPVNRLRCLVL